ncbi:hypothetical protein G0R13_002607 [Salmonella enterica]|nr:hypothetical protein [Salmonella enterica]
MKRATVIVLIFLFIGKCNGIQFNDIYKVCNIEHINNIEIIYYPVYINTYTAMSDKELQLRYIYKLEIINIRESPEYGEILKMLNIKYVNGNKKSDIRWGVRISSEDNKFCQLYFDGFGKYGKINDTNVSFEKNNIIEWVRKKAPLFVEYDNLLSG